MSDRGRPRGRERWGSDHERAQQRAAERLSLPLPAAENAWLDRHLGRCRACAEVASQYEEQQAELRALEDPLPPRDLWARTAAALDRAERQAPDVPSPSVFPGRGGLPDARGARSIRGLRAERRASTYRSARVLPRRPLGERATGRAGGLGWVAPFGILAALAVVIVVGGTALLNTGGVPLATPASLAAGTGRSIPTPIDVGVDEVAWLTPAQDGTYSLNFVQVDKVCPADAQPDCAPIGVQSSPRQLPTVRSVPHTVLRSPSRTQLVVVPASTKKRGGGSVIVVTVPPQATPAANPSAPAESSSVGPSGPLAVSLASPSAAVVPSAAATGGAAASGGPTSSGPSQAPVAASAPPASASEQSPASPSEPVAATGAASSETITPPTAGIVEPSATAPLEASGSPSSPGVAAASIAVTEPEPTATALAIISNIVVVGESAAYSPDGAMLAFSARPADGSQGPDIYLWRVGEASARALTFDHASLFSGWLGNRLIGSRMVDAAGQLANSAEPGQSSAFRLPLLPSAPAGLNVGGGLEPSADGGSPAVGGEASPHTAPSFASMPSLPAFGSLPIASPSAISASGSEGPFGTENAAQSTLGNEATVGSSDLPTTLSSGEVARTFILDPVTGSEMDLAAPAWRPVVDPSGRFVAYWAGTLRYDAASLTWIPDRGTLAIASWPALTGTDPNAVLAPVPLLGDAATDVPAGEWDIRWDESGTHLAFWAADVDNPELGRLTLLTIDANGRVDPTGISLHGAPALAGFSIGNGRLAWATPPGEDGQGSRVQVLAWSGENAGKIDSQPASGDNAVIIVR